MGAHRLPNIAHAQNLAHVSKILPKLITYRKPLNPTNFDTLNHVSNFSNPSGIGKVAVRLGQNLAHMGKILGMGSLCAPFAFTVGCPNPVLLKCSW